MKKKAFTLAEVLITLAIIGVVAAIAIPSVISNSQQQEFKTGLRKAVSVLNSAITMNMVIDGESPYDNANLYGYLMRHMSVMKSTTQLIKEYMIQSQWQNAAFYTTDGMRFELREGHNYQRHKLYEGNVYACYGGQTGDLDVVDGHQCGGCGSYGLNNNSDGTTKPPCIMTVDVNGDRKPNPANINCKNRAYATKSHRFLFLLRFVHSFRLRFIHNGGYQQLRFVSGSSPAKTCTLVLCFYAG